MVAFEMVFDLLKSLPDHSIMVAAVLVSDLLKCLLSCLFAEEMEKTSEKRKYHECDVADRFIVGVVYQRSVKAFIWRTRPQVAEDAEGRTIVENRSSNPMAACVAGNESESWIGRVLYFKTVRSDNAIGIRLRENMAVFHLVAESIPISRYDGEVDVADIEELLVPGPKRCLDDADPNVPSTSMLSCPLVNVGVSSTHREGGGEVPSIVIDEEEEEELPEEVSRHADEQPTSRCDRCPRPVLLMAMVAVFEPACLEESRRSVDLPTWQLAMKRKFCAFQRTCTGFAQSLPLGEKAIGTRWFCKIKPHLGGDHRDKTHRVVLVSRQFDVHVPVTVCSTRPDALPDADVTDDVTRCCSELFAFWIPWCSMKRWTITLSSSVPSLSPAGVLPQACSTCYQAGVLEL